MANGHPRAREYPIGMVWGEARIVIARINTEHAMRAVLLRAAISATESKDGARDFDAMIKELTDG